MQILTGHTSPETAHTVANYPYGFRLRTSISYWIETKKGFGQRMVSQTVNPKTGRLNKPKAGTYSAILLLALDEQEHVTSIGLHGSASEETIAAFKVQAGNTLDPYQQAAMKWVEAAQRVDQHLTVEVHICEPGCDKEHQTNEEKQRIYRGLIAREYAHAEGNRD